MATTTPFDTIKSFASSGLSEATILSTRFQMPILKYGQQTFPEQKAGSVPYNPECMKFVKADTLKKTLLQDFTPSAEPVEMALPPIDARSPLFSEDDNRRDLSYKVYLPLSRLLQKKHRMSFSTDCPWQVSHGAADTRVIARKYGRKLVAIKEKSESLFQGLLVDELTFSDACKEGREDMNMGLNNQTQDALFACPLVLAQLLGYMKADQVAYGIIMTSGRAYFVWVSAQESKQPASDEGGQSAPKKQKVDNSDIFSNQGPGIYLSECVMVNDDDFLKVLYLFLVCANLSQENKLRGVMAGKLLALPSSQGGFLEGPEQRKMNTPGKSRSSRKTTKTPDDSAADGQQHQTTGTTSPSLICLLPTIPTFKEGTLLANSLGRDKQGWVVATDWHGIPAAVKVITNVREARQYFESEVRAYDLAGKAGLWDVAVPRPLFIASDDSRFCLGLKAGRAMPSDPLEWSDINIFQARQSAQMLFDHGIELTDMKPSNFVSMDIAGQGERVLVIDLEMSRLEGDADHLEIPRWLLRGANRPTLVSP